MGKYKLQFAEKASAAATEALANIEPYYIAGYNNHLYIKDDKGNVYVIDGRGGFATDDYKALFKDVFGYTWDSSYGHGRKFEGI